MIKSDIFPIFPDKITIQGVDVLERKIFYDPRGFLIETFSEAKEKAKSVYSYTSLTRPGWARDEDKFHFHKFQKDRFTTIFGKMWILLYDARDDSPTFGKLEVVEANGGDPIMEEKTTFPVYTITVPEGVYHGIKNPGPSLSILVNHPTQEYSPQDEGRLPFAEVPIPSLNGTFFAWKDVRKE